VDEDALDRRQHLPDARHLRLGLPPAADHAEARRAVPREVARRDGGGRARAELAEPVGLDHRLEASGRREEHDRERRSRGRPGVRLEPGKAELPVDAGHDRVLPLLEREPRPGSVVDGVAGEPPEAFLDRGDGLGRREQSRHVGLGQVQRHLRRRMPEAARRCAPRS
jgi:hypothetical protein